MKLIKAHMWLYQCHAKMVQPNSKLYFADFMLSDVDVEYMSVLMEDGLVEFIDSLYEVTEKGYDIIQMIDAYKEL